MLARSRLHAVRMELRVLVERSQVCGIAIAKHEAAVTAVVAALEKGEGFLAGWGVANECVGVGFPVFACRGGGCWGEVVIFHFCGSWGCFLLAAGGGGGAPAEGATGLGAFEAFGTAVDAARRSEWGWPRGFLCWS